MFKKSASEVGSLMRLYRCFTGCGSWACRERTRMDPGVANGLWGLLKEWKITLEKALQANQHGEPPRSVGRWETVWFAWPPPVRGERACLWDRLAGAGTRNITGVRSGKEWESMAISVD